jgi:peptidoglycan/xylan/chitin deacetylase (PgdA/CDA1 family)
MKQLLPVLLATLLMAAAPNASAAPTLVMITVDVESYTKGTPDQQIWGKQPDGEHGIRRMMDMLDRHGFKGTFYLNVYEAAKHGDGILAEVARTIHGRGHDLQLHTHPSPMFKFDTMQNADVEQQVAVLSQGKDLIRQWTGKTVIAHRAGAFAANQDTLAACQRAGLAIDSSFSPVSTLTDLSRQLPASNMPRVIDGVVELPLTYIAQARLGNWQSLRYLDIEGTSYDEFVSAIRQFRDADFPVVNIVMHSFSFVRHGKTDASIEQRFDKLLGFLKAEPGVQVVTVSQLHPQWTTQVATLQQGSNFVPHTGVWLMYQRALEDFMGWKNIVVALTPLILLVVIAASVVLWRRRNGKGAQVG